MESSEENNHSTLWMVRAEELFPKTQIVAEDGSLHIPFNELSGESVKYLGRHENNGMLAISNYRLYLSWNTEDVSVPLGLIEMLQIKDLFQLLIVCKDARTYKCSFATSESCSEWCRRLSLVIGIPEQLENLFAFAFHAWVSEQTQIADQEWFGRLQRAGDYDEIFRREVDRMHFDLTGAWRITYANIDFKLCQSYPKMIIVPACISDDTLQNVASFRSSRRIPAVTWRHRSGAVIARCSQPEVGWLGWRNSKDEQLLKALADACSFDNGRTSSSRFKSKYPSSDTAPSSPDSSNPEEVTLDEPKKILIVDARSYASAVTNRARGGGVECAEYYPSAEIQFMSLGNIHVIRKSFHNLRQLCASPPDVVNWYSQLDRTLWLQHMSGLLAASLQVCHAIEKNHRPVMIHCSDGWDRTPQISATAQLCLDPFYRTIEGFSILVEKEWLSFGHKFGDRCGHGVSSDETNERCPVFLQWIDCVHQIHRQFPCSFEFSMGYLIKLVQHCHSNLFGTFLCNTMKERLESHVPDRTFSIWSFLSGPMYKNPLFIPNREKVLWPAYNVRDLAFWSEVYLGNLRNSQIDCQAIVDLTDKIIDATPVKTRSFGDIVSEIEINGLTRRSSDPSMIVDTIIPSYDASEQNSINLNDSQPSSVNELFLTSVVQSTTQKLQELTLELNGDILDKCDAGNGFQIEEEHKSEIEASTDTLIPLENQSLSLTESNLSLLKGEIKCDEETRKSDISQDESCDTEHKHEKCKRHENEVSKYSSSDEMVFQMDLNTKSHRRKHKYSNSISCKIDANESASSTATTDSILSTPGIKSLPFTPPCLLLERNNSSSYTFSDGLNHALSDQNLRLQQLVYEHKLKEEALQKELHAMRMALLKKTNCQCPLNSCNAGNVNQFNGDEMNSNVLTLSTDSADKKFYQMLIGCNIVERQFNFTPTQVAVEVKESPPLNDCNLENLSNCSWEAIDEKNQALPVLWVPDHAVSRCSSCQIEFWLGRRKHHCRNCGFIFCADCSEFFAPLPDETLFQPVRLCGSCYKNINVNGKLPNDGSSSHLTMHTSEKHTDP